VRSYEVTPEQFGVARATLADIAGGDATVNAQIIRNVLAGNRSPHRDIVVLNAAAAFLVAGAADSIVEAIPLATNSIDSGAARSKLQSLVEFTHSSAVNPE